MSKVGKDCFSAASAASSANAVGAPETAMAPAVTAAAPATKFLRVVVMSMGALLFSSAKACGAYRWPVAAPVATAPLSVTTMAQTVAAAIAPRAVSPG